MTETPPSDDDLKLLKRHWPFGFDPDPDLVWSMAEEIYGGAKNWEDEEFAVDLATLRPVRKGGLASKGRIDRMMMKRWRSGERPIPEWVAYGLLRLPEIVLTRRQKDVDRWLGELKAEDGKARDFIAAEEVRLAAWIASQLEQRVPMIERDPVKRPPPPRPPTPDWEWPPVSAEEVERAEDIGSLAAKVAMGVVEPEPAPRPEHPALADAWERGWSEAYDYELAGMREEEERRAAGEAAALAIRERERAFVAKEHARREARRAAALKRKLAK